MADLLVAATLSSMELLHATAHTLVLVGLWRFNRQELRDGIAYFWSDALTVQASCLFTGLTGYVLAFGHLLLHLAHIFTWDESEFCKRVISWSSTSWRGSRIEPVLIAGTVYDIVTHLYFAHTILTLYPAAMPFAALAVSLTALYHAAQYARVIARNKTK